MKLASLKEGGRDGTLIVVSRDLSRGVRVPQIAATLQQAIEDWDRAAPALGEVYTALNRGDVPQSFAVDPQELASPLPRAFQFLDGSVYLHHMEKARKARGADMPPNYKTDPLMYQGLSDRFIGPRDPMVVPDEALGLDYEAELAVVLGDVPMGTSAAQASGHIKLLMLLNDFTLRALTRTELPKGFGFMQAKPTSSFSPVAVTPDELGAAWDGEKLDLPILSSINGQPMGRANTGRDMFFTYRALIAHAARTRSLSAGTIIGAGAVSNLDPETGYACLAEKRADEELAGGRATTPWLRWGDRVRIEMLDAGGASIFGAIDNAVAKA
ncbi:fumarylacetoacetate hydrolase family protein [Variovorax sp. YR216]|uniref:fumarylacetoacetate hydrolase family protein n=1 Tax=Variovorax sp. YR216 TaxID=1882828 RepID=UPI00089D8AAE|nr:fumarylacetoacetate hydrolase family protein [Variovorax sp. YR216]SEB23650.1 fumarylacetoacetate (FAA) hydrolase [Variovorax sp. YR216]